MSEDADNIPRRLLRRVGGLSRNVLALSAVSLLNDTSSEIIYPLLPTFLALTLGASPFAIGLIEGIAESVASLLKLVSGYVSDKFGNRKLPVFIGYACAALTRPFLSFVTTWPQVLMVRTADRVGKGIRGSPRDALIASSTPVERRGFAFGFNRAADNMGAVIGPIIAFLLLYFIAVNHESPTAREYQQVFLYASIPVVFGLLVIVFFVHEKEADKPANGSQEPIKLSLKGFDSTFKWYLGVLALFTLSNSTDAFLLLRAQQAGIDPPLLPLLWMVLNVSKVLSSLVFGHMSDRVGRRVLIVSGWAVYALVYAGFAFVSAPWQAWTLFIIYGTYFGLTEGNEKALVADMVNDEKRGTAFGFYNLAYGITVLPASILVWTGMDQIRRHGCLSGQRRRLDRRGGPVLKRGQTETCRQCLIMH
jgi:Permeases of the major facilitator superfamily